MHPAMDFAFPAPAPPSQPSIAQLPHPFKQEEENFSAGIFDSNDDHRRRRRNRTSMFSFFSSSTPSPTRFLIAQSCWSCHQAKRRCDRKRPCSRCIQLGLTGLCVYETDDPASRDDPTLSETQRLRNRIAELEKLVRELKNKPHPKWAGPGGMFKGPNGNTGTNGSGTGTGTNPPGTPMANGTSWRIGDTNGSAMDTDSPYSTTATASNYRFPPLNTLGVPLSLSLDANGASASANGTNGTAYSDPNSSYYGLDNRRPSLVSNASTNTGTGNSSPRTPYMGYYSSASSSAHPNHQHYSAYGSASGGLNSNPCGCLSSLTTSNDDSGMDVEDPNSGVSTTVANKLARAIRSVILESGVTHPFAEGCKVLALVRELENIGSTSGGGGASQSQSSSQSTYTATAPSQTSSQSTAQPQSTATNGYTNSYFSAMSNAAQALSHQQPHTTPPPPSLTPSTSTTGTSASSPSSYASHTHTHTHGGHSHIAHPTLTHSHLGVTSHHHHPSQHHQQHHQPQHHQHQHQPQSHTYYDSDRHHPSSHTHNGLTNGYTSYTTSYYSSTNGSTNGANGVSTNGGTTSPSLSPPTGLMGLGVAASE